MPSAYTDYATPQALGFQALNKGLDSLGQGLEAYRQQQNLEELGKIAAAGDLKSLAAKAIAMGKVDAGVGLLGTIRAQDDDNQFYQMLGGGGGVPAAGGGSARPAGAPRAAADPAVEQKFISTLKANGLTNPAALAVVAAYGNRESSYSPTNVTGSWSDPSESGQPGTAGGVLSWRGPRYEAMKAATAGAADPVEAQAKFFLAENPDLTRALQNVKTPEEAHQLLAPAWKFAGYNRPGGEFDARLQLARSYLPKVGGGAPAPSPVIVANNEAQVQQAERDTGMMPADTSGADRAVVSADAGRWYATTLPATQRDQIRAQAARDGIPLPAAIEQAYRSQAGQSAPVQVAQGPAPASDLPQADAKEVQFVIPGTGETIRASQMTPGLQRAIEVSRFAKTPEARAVANKLIDGEMQRIKEAEKEAKELRLNTQRSVTDPAERKALGIPDDYKGPIQIDGYGKITAPTKPVAEIKNEGTIPGGYQVERDDQGRPLRMIPIPGSPAAKEVADANEKKATQQKQVEQTGSSVFNALDDIDRIMTGSRFPVTGGIGKTLSQIPGTNAHDVASALNTLKANISFERLNQMRQASPTGGALGGVTEGEHKLLSGSLAALEQSQSADQFKRNLIRARTAFEQVVHGKVLSPEERSANIQNRETASSPGQPSSAMAPPKPGQLDQGYRFRGGDPADPKNWIKVQ